MSSATAESTRFPAQRSYQDDQDRDTNTTDCGRLIVTKAATLVGNVTFKFINGFAPKTGDHFDFLSVGGAHSGTFARVGLQNLGCGFQCLPHRARFPWHERHLEHPRAGNLLSRQEAKTQR